MSKKHKTPEYVAWFHMKQRCLDPNDKNYPNYGGRGIRVHDDWFSFDEFLKDMGPRPGPDYSLDRIDNDWDYEPGNCRWATRSEQNLNRRPFGIKLSAEDCHWIRLHAGEVTQRAMAEKFNVNQSTISDVIRKVSKL